MRRREADEAKRDVQRITPEERVAWQQAIAESRGEVVRARQDAIAEAMKSQAEALEQSAEIRRQIASSHSQAFKHAMAGIDQAHLGKTLAEALKCVPGNTSTAEIERQVDAALKKLPQEMDVPIMTTPEQVGKKIIIDHAGRYVIPKGSGVIIEIPLHHVDIVGDTMTVD